LLLPRSACAKDDRVGVDARSDAEWRAALPTSSYLVLRRAATEPPWSSPLEREKREGTFACAGCGAPLFSSAAKFNSGTGWPSFWEALPKAVREEGDYSIAFLPRAEVRCTRCEGHLGVRGARPACARLTRVASTCLTTDRRPRACAIA